MKQLKLLICLFAFNFAFTTDAQCPDDNTFLMNATPPPNIGISTFTVNCMNGGQYATVDVVAGNTYTFSTCGNTAFDTQITVLNSLTNAFIGYNDDDCGVQSTVTWVATFTGSVDVLVDEFNCSNTGFCTDLVITCTPPVQNGSGCNTNTTICTAGVAGPFGFSTPGPQVSSCLDFFGPTYAYIVLYITQSGPLELLIDGDATTGFLDVAIFDVPPGVDPCVASLSTTNEIACNYATASSGCNQIGNAFPCPSSVPSPNVVAGDVLFIVVENWSGTSNNFTMSLGPSPAAQTGPPDATITPAGPFCSTDAPVQLNAADNGGTWTGPGVSPSGVFDPGAVGPGTYTLDYTIGSMPCTDADQTTIVVTNCNCLITNFSGNIGSCEAATNTFTVTGDFTYTGNPVAGNLIVEVTNGSGTYTQTFSPPFTDGQLYNYSIAGIPSDGTPLTITIYFTNDVSCTAQLTSTSPASCACSADIGTFSIATSGTQTGNDFVLCYGDDLNITANGDYSPPAEANNPPGPAYTPSIAWLVYSCPPTIALTPDPILTIPDDPCLLGIVSGTDLNELNDMFWINAYPGTFTNNTVYFMPITMYSTTNAPQIYSYVNTTMPCYETGNIYSVQYIPEITAVSVEDCVLGTVTTTVSGGEASMNGSLFTGMNLVPATASFAPGTAPDAGDIVVVGLVDGDVYSYDIVDASGCSITITGTFVGIEDPAFTYPQTAYCQNDADPSPTITGVIGGTFSSGAGLSINPATGLINLAASTAGTYTITYQTPDPLCFGTSTFDLTINPVPIVDGNNETICAGGSVTLNGTGADTYTWTNGVTNGVAFSPAAATTYTVTGTITATGCNSTGTATVTITPLDDPSFTTTNYCAGSVSPAPVVTGLAGGTFAFNPAPMGPTINATTGVVTGGVGGSTYTIEYTTDGACPQSSTEAITVYDLPPVDAQDVSVCFGATATITATGAATYFWDNGLGAGQTHNVTPAVNTVYTVTGTDANGCVNTDAMTVILLSTAPISAGADVTICAGNSTTLTATGGTSYMWLAPINATGASQTVSPATTTTYTVDVSDANGCTGTDDVVVTVNSPPTATIAGTSTICQNGVSPTITFTGANEIAPYTFTYNINGGANQTLTSVGTTATIMAPTNVVGTFDYNLVSVSGSSATGCSQAQSGTATVTVVPNPTATISGTTNVCLGDANPTITLTGADGTAPYTFTYNVNNTGDVTITSVGDIATISVPTAVVGVFNFNLISVDDAASGCSQLQAGTATITVNDLPIVFAGNDLTICEGDQAILTGSGAVSYVWDQGVVNGALFTPLATNTYTVTGTDANGCVNTDDVIITLEPAPVVSFIGDNLSGCVPLTVTFTNTTPGLLDNCVWTYENGTVLYGCGSVTTTFTTPGMYDVTLTTTSTTGCAATTTYTDYIYVEADPIASFSPSSTVISNLNPEVYFENMSTGAVDYDWNFGDGSPTVNIESPTYQYPDNDFGSYDVELIAYSPLGCTDTAYATIQVTEEVIFYVPNTFTPDFDDYNPTFQPVFNSGYDPFDFTLLIFNRWGEIIFESHNADIGWNGTYGGELMQDGTYTWKIEFKTTTSDERRVVVGHVNLMQ